MSKYIKGDGEFDIKLMIREYDVAFLKKGLLNIALQLLIDTRYTKEKAVEEIIEIIKEIED
jgi:hypothetical protein